MLALFGIITLVMQPGPDRRLGRAFPLARGVPDTLQEAVYHPGQSRHPGLWRHRHEPASEAARPPGGGQRCPLMIGLPAPPCPTVLQHHIRKQPAGQPPESEG